MKLNEPAHVGMCILDLSQVMYKFHYDYIKNKYGNNSGLLFTGTDSLLYKIKTEDVYEDFHIDKEMLDIECWCCYRRICWIKAKDAFVFER